MVNTGSPESPTEQAVRIYLREFLSDQRVIKVPRWLWLPILNGIILNSRPKRSAQLYQKIWEPNGAPLLNISQQQAADIFETLRESSSVPILVTYGMRYGKPSISERLKSLLENGATRFIVLPLFPQYSGTTTGSIEDAVTNETKKWEKNYPIEIIPYYYNFPGYIQAIVQSIQETWSEHGKSKRLLLSYHGIPESYCKSGDPYYQHCENTTRLIVEHLNLEDEDWQMSFQSRLGPIKWLRPYTDQVLEQWGAEGLESVNVICPGFATDCLETLYEIDYEGRRLFKQAGGKDFYYIRSLNNHPEHIKALSDILLSYIKRLPDITNQ